MNLDPFNDLSPMPQAISGGFAFDSKTKSS